MKEQDQLALEATKKYSLFATGAGLIPVPLVDWVAITALQVKMLSELAKIYGVPFAGNRASSVVAALLSGLAGTSAGYGLVGFTKAIPVLGTALGALTVPAAAGAVTYAVGRVFTQHFASGGTLFDFDPEKMREYFQAELKAAKAPTAKAA